MAKGEDVVRAMESPPASSSLGVELQEPLLRFFIAVKADKAKESMAVAVLCKNHWGEVADGVICFLLLAEKVLTVATAVILCLTLAQELGAEDFYVLV
ncbi:conserved hypothetical protein [Ricinus communis]|uniref:Uncharacterized protein n=1 Tax=Ricinus communis TaxID=3988 RepID=B9SFV4_RICCO|nr:conserved hypothetical protein [Ricinus communis]